MQVLWTASFESNILIKFSHQRKSHKINISNIPAVELHEFSQKNALSPRPISKVEIKVWYRMRVGKVCGLKTTLYESIMSIMSR